MGVLDVLNTIQNKNKDSQLSVDDTEAMNFDMTPEEAEQFKSFYPMTGATGALRQSDYFPGYNSNVAAGGYSGSEIGSTTLFAPNSALVPIGMMDARDAAIQKAAMQKALEVDNWKKLQAKTPQSELTNINQNLTDSYINFTQGAMQDAVKKFKDPYLAMKYLDSNPEYQAKKQSYFNTAKFGTDVAHSVAKNRELAKTGNFIYTPELKQAEMAVINASDPNSPEFKNFSNIVRNYGMEQELNNDLTTLFDKAKMSQMASAGVDMKDPDAIKAYESTTEFYSPQVLQSIKEQLKAIHAGSSIYTPEKIDRAVDNFGSAVRQKKDVSVTKKDKPSGSDVLVPWNNNAQEVTKYNTNTATGGVDGAPRGVRTGQVSGINAQRVPPSLFNGKRIVLNKGVSLYDVEKGGLVPSVGAGEVTPTEIVNMRYVKGSNVPILDDQAETGKYEWEWKPTVVFNSPSYEDKDQKVPTYKTFYSPVEENESLLATRDANGKIVKGMDIDTLKAYAEYMNKQKGQQEGWPKIGTEDGGYRYKGGDPSDAKNWEKI